MEKKVCILNKTTNVVENICKVDDINNVPSFLIGENQILATDHTGKMEDTWNGSSYDTPVEEDTRTDEIKWLDIRETRNTLLSHTDFYALSDSTLTDPMKTYRQQLRDLPTSKSDPDDIVFPTKP